MMSGPQMSLTLARVEFFDANLTRRIEQDSPEVLTSLHIPQIVYFGSEFPDDTDDGGDGVPTILSFGQTPSP